MARLFPEGESPPFTAKDIASMSPRGFSNFAKLYHRLERRIDQRENGQRSDAGLPLQSSRVKSPRPNE